MEVAKLSSSNSRGRTNKFLYIISTPFSSLLVNRKRTSCWLSYKLYLLTKKWLHSSIVRFDSANVAKKLCFQKQKKLIDFSEMSQSELPKLYLLPWLDSEDTKIHQKILRVFNTLRKKVNDSYNNNLFPQGVILKSLPMKAKNYSSLLTANYLQRTF